MKKLEDKIIDFLFKNENWLSCVFCVLMVYFSDVMSRQWWQILLFCLSATLWGACCGIKGLKDRDDK